MERINFHYVKTRLKSIALSLYYGYDVLQMPLNISKAVALNRLCKNRDIIIMSPDKGNGIIILNHTDYIGGFHRCHYFMLIFHIVHVGGQSDSKMGEQALSQARGHCKEQV